MPYLKTKVLKHEYDPNNLQPMGPNVSHYPDLSYYFAECRLFRDDNPEERVEDYRLIHSTSPSALAARLATKDTELVKQVPVFVDDIPELVSDARKYIFPLRPEYFHFLIDNLSCVFKLHEYDPEASFFFIAYEEEYENSPRHRELTKNLNFLKLVMSLNGIKLEILKPPHSLHDRINYYVYRTNNGILVDDSFNVLQLTLKDITTNYNNYVLDKICKSSISNPPTRKVYISRGSLVKFVNSEATDRIFDENLIEEYLESKGFEILRPESLKTIEEQVKLLAETSVLVGVTGSGLINQLFMRDGSTVIELKVEEYLAPKIQESFSYYADFAYGKSHTYVGLDVSDRRAETVIEKLDALFEKSLLA